MPDNLSEVPLPGERRHQPELDGIRGIAILLVLGSHAAGVLGVLPESPSLRILLQNLLVPGMGRRVDLFFVLSGFLITGISAAHAKTSAHYFQSFYARRVLRIFPIYYLALIGTLVVQHFFPGIKWLAAAARRGAALVLYLSAELSRCSGRA
jgi:peptidoglycan/LPS O-acetylase OafA/YrhL